MERYNEYKDSSVQWLGEIPSHWGLRRTKYVWKETDSRSEFGSEQLLSVSQYDGVREAQSDSRSESLKGYKIVKQDELVINIMLAWLGGLGVSKHEGIVSPAYCVYKLQDAQNPRFLHYLYRTPMYLAEFARHSTGIVPSRWRMYTDDFGEVLTLLPPIEEQDAMVAYLDTATAKIDEAIAQQQKMIDLLNERKQIIINNAVTKGLNPDAPMKDSGVDWIGKIPEHWEICKLKRVANGFSNGTSATQITFGTTPYSVTRIETITTGSINYDKVGYVKKDSSLNRYLLKKNDVLISNINSFERVGNCAIYDGQHELYHGMNLLRITPLDNIVPEYLLYSLKSANYMGQMRRACKPAINQVSVPSSVVKGIIITFPPLSEQEEIAIYCSRALQCIEDSVDNCKKQISLLQERKQIIINDVVTGKVKVS